MALAPALLANGQLPSAKSTLFTATTDTIVKSITLVNTDVVSRTVNLYIKRASSRRIIPVNLSLGAGSVAIVDDLVISSGDLIEGDASVATIVDYSICGAAS